MHTIIFLLSWNAANDTSCMTGPIPGLFGVAEAPYVGTFCQSFDLDGDGCVDLFDLAIWMTDECCLASNCIRPEHLLETDCNADCEELP